MQRDISKKIKLLKLHKLIGLARKQMFLTFSKERKVAIVEGMRRIEY
jgi:hypothetical protein